MALLMPARVINVKRVELTRYSGEGQQKAVSFKEALSEIKMEQAIKSDRSGRSGFTLIELLLVVIIIGVIAAIALPRFSDAKSQAYTSTLASDLRTLAQNMELVGAAGTQGYPVCIDIASDNLCPDIGRFNPSPQVRISTEIGSDARRGWYGNARHARLPSSQSKCLNVGDTAATAPAGGFDNDEPNGTPYKCNVAY